ncbi:MAG TPA: hypothetical protein VIG67_03445 [Yaniella sp.]
MKSQRTLLAGVALLVAVTLAACGSSEDTGAADESSNAEEAKVVEVADHPGSVEDYVGALEDVELETCSAGGQGLDVAGAETTEWETQLDLTQDEVRCVLRAEQFSVE